MDQANYKFKQTIPHVPNKAREGRTDDTRPCIACTQSCVGRRYLGMGVGCIYNPVTGREATRSELHRAETLKKVAIAKLDTGPLDFDTRNYTVGKGGSTGETGQWRALGNV